jgi:hypothetical protein
MSLIALYYVCSVGIYYVYCLKNNETIWNGQSDHDVTVKHTEK